MDEYWLLAYNQKCELSHSEWEDSLDKLEINNDEKYWFKEIYADAQEADYGAMFDQQAMLLNLSKQLPNLTIRLFRKGPSLADEWVQTYYKGQLIDFKHINDYRDLSYWIKQENPDLYYSYMATREEKPSAQNNRYQLKRLMRGIKIMRRIFRNNAASKIQRVWDRYWYKPNEQGRSRAALKGYAELMKPSSYVSKHNLYFSGMGQQNPKPAKLPVVVRFAFSSKFS